MIGKPFQPSPPLDETPQRRGYSQSASQAGPDQLAREDASPSSPRGRSTRRWRSCSAVEWFVFESG
jgi:hypothetical protein